MYKFKCTEKKSGKVTTIDAKTSKQAIYKLALSNVGNIEDKQEKRLATGRLYEAMLKSYSAIKENDPNQLSLF